MALPFRRGRDPFGRDAMQWYYANEGQRHGPISVEEFTSLVESGVIRPDTLVWRAGMPTWKPFADLGPPPLAATPVPPASSIDPVSVGVGLDANGASAAVGSGVVIQGYGGFWRRFGAKLIDGFITNIISFVFQFPLFFAMLGGSGLLSPGEEPTPEQMAVLFAFQLIAVGIQILIGILYSVIFLKKYAATPGKMLLGLKVYRADSRPLSVGQIIGRYFAEMLSSLIFCIGYIMAAFDAEKRTLHDRIVDSRVVLVRQ